MNVKALLGFGILAGGLYWLSTKKKFVKSAVFTFEKLDFNLKKKKVFVSLGLLNPTNQEVTLNSVVGTLFVNSNQVATVESFEKKKISSRAKSVITLALSPSAVGIVNVLKQFVKSKLKGAGGTSATFTGSAHLNGTTIPIQTKLI